MQLCPLLSNFFSSPNTCSFLKGTSDIHLYKMVKNLKPFVRFLKFFIAFLDWYLGLRRVLFTLFFKILIYFAESLLKLSL
jgi:hypothetical protein